MKKRCEPVALFDLDSTLCDYEGALKRDMKALRSPMEPPYTGVPHDNAPAYLRNRANLIRSFESWWTSLDPFKLGFDVWSMAEQIGYRRVILTQAPRCSPAAWSGKKKWIDQYLGPDTDAIITRDKGLVYGKILVDDWPEYVIRWLEWRPRGLVIMPAQEHNKGFEHPQVIRYTGRNFKVVRKALASVYNTTIED
jgi:5'-nucleotidase